MIEPRCSVVLLLAALFAGCGPKGGEDFKLGLQSYSLRAFDVRQAIRSSSELELDVIELYPGHFPIESTSEERTGLRDYLEQMGIELVAYGVIGFNEDEQMMRRVFEFAREMGIDVLTVNPTARELDLLENYVAEFDIKIAIHNHGPGARYDTLEDVLTALENRDPRMGACIDTGHFMRSGEDPVDCAHRLGARVHLVHLKDIKRTPEGDLFTVQGEGDMNMPAFFDALRQVGYSGPLSLEYEENEQNPMPDIHRCMENVRAALAQS